MSNALYDWGRDGALDGSIVWGTDTFKAILVTSGYTVNLSTHKFLTDVPGGDIVATSPSLSGASHSAGIADATDLVFTAVSGSAAAYVVIYKDTGTGSTSRLLAYIDTATGLPVTPNGGDITIAWDNGSNKIFKL